MNIQKPTISDLTNMQHDHTSAAQGGTISAGMAIGGTVTSGTTGSILFVGAGPVLAQNNAGLFWDNSGNQLGVGIVAPQAKLHVAGPINTDDAWPFTPTAIIESAAGSSQVPLDFRIDGVVKGNIKADNAGGFVLTGGGNVAFFSGSTPLMTGLSTGEVGVGTIAPTAKFTVLNTTAGAVELCSLNSVYGVNNVQKSLTWRDGTNITGQIGTYYDGAYTNMAFGHLYNGGYQTTDLMTLMGNGNFGVGVAIPTSHLQVGGNLSRAAWTTTGLAFDVAAATYTDTSTAAAGTVAVRTANSFSAPTFASTNAITVSDAFSLYVPKPIAGTNTTITRANSAYFEGAVGIGTTSPAAQIHSLATTEQLRLGYDAANYASFTVGATGVLTVNPTGNVIALGGGTTATSLRFLEPSGSGTNYSEFKAVAQAANITYSLPSAVGAAGTYLKDAAGDGVLSWATPSAAVRWDQITAPTTTLGLTMPAGSETTFTVDSTTQAGFTWTTSTLTTGKLLNLAFTGTSAVATAASSGSILSLTSSTTGFTAATQRIAAIYSTGANSNASVVLQGLDISVANTGTTNTNQALRLSASGASTTNIALDLAAGELRLAGSAGLSGKILVSGGVNASPVWSTPTFPNASATTRKIIVSDGTNWTASTETYAVPGTSGNLLTSDGTNWTSAAPAAAAVPKTVILSTMFETSGRFTTDSVAGTGAATFNTNGLNLATGSTQASAVRVTLYTTAGNGTMESGSPTWSCSTQMPNAVITSLHLEYFVGYADPITVSGTAHTFTMDHAGFKMIGNGSAVALSATQANGTTETASSSLVASVAGNDNYEFIIVKNGTTSIDYYYSKNAAALSSATNLSTNLPRGGIDCVSQFSVNNANTTDSFSPRLTGCTYSR